MKVITYNILDGFEDAPERKKSCALWLNNQAPDIVFLNELNYFTPETLKSFAQEWGHTHSILLEGKSRYRIAITSNTPITNINNYFEDLQGHGVITCESNGIQLINTHLNPHDIDKRHHDLDFILEKIKSLESDHKYILFGGDLNSFHIDEKAYYADDINHIRKYYVYRAQLHEHFKNLKDGELDFTIPKRLMESLMIDLLGKCNDEYSISFPTELGKSKQENQKMLIDSGINPDLIEARIDYLWASQKLAERCISCTVPGDRFVEMISDHYPLVAEFDKLN